MKRSWYCATGLDTTSVVGVLITRLPSSKIEEILAHRTALPTSDFFSVASQSKS